MNSHILLILVVSLFIIFKETKCDFEYEDHDEPPKNSNNTQFENVTDSNETSFGEKTSCVICSKCPGNQVLLRGKCRTIKSKFLFSLKF
jgi:hypothetical protein